MSMDVMPKRTLLLETKLAPPIVRGGIIRRTRLLTTLDEASGGAALTLVAAPAGYGKTMLLSMWAVEQRMPLIWVTLDPGDRDPVRLWTHVAAAASRAIRGLGSGALEQLAVPVQGIDASIDALLTGLTAYGDPIAMVLDDLDSLDAGESMRSIELAIALLPSNARLIVTARADPDLGLTRLRGRHMLAEIRARELAFTAAEAREVLVRGERIPLTNASVDLLVERTEGWPAALYLSALWLRDRESPNEAVERFGASLRQVSDYLSDELVASLDPDLRSFLRETALLRRFTPQLCDAALDRDDSRELLAELERSNLLLIRLDSSGEWYRYHALFEELLLLEPPMAPDPAVVHRRAAAWLREHGFVEDAIAHAADGDDLALAAEILAESMLELGQAGRTGFVFSWLERLPAELLVAHPLLSAGGAIIAALVGRSPVEVERLLLLAEHARRTRPENWLPICEVYIAGARSISVENDDVRASLRHARIAVEVARTSVKPELGPALAILGRALFFVGDLPAARQVVHEEVTLPDAKKQPHGYVAALGLLAAIESQEGQPEHAAALARDAIAFARLRGLSDSWLVAFAHVGLAHALSQLGDLAAAEREAHRAEGLRRGSQLSVTHAYALLRLTDVQIARSRIAQARVSLTAAEHEIAEFTDPGWLGSLSTELATRLEAPSSETVHDVVETPSPGELAVLQHLPSDLTQREIAEQLYLSLNTVRTHIRSIYRKLGVGSREAAVARADALDLVEGVGRTASHQGDLGI
jgi:LuxR family maltose regulon positive regulatory protein